MKSSRQGRSIFIQYFALMCALLLVNSFLPEHANLMPVTSAQSTTDAAASNTTRNKTITVHRKNNATYVNVTDKCNDFWRSNSWTSP